MGLVPVKGQVVAGNPPDLGQPHIEGVFDAFVQELAKVRTGQVGQRHPDSKLFVSLLQGAFDIRGHLQDAIDVVFFVIQGDGLPVEEELLVHQISFGVDPEPVRPRT